MVAAAQCGVEAKWRLLLHLDKLLELLEHPHAGAQSRHLESPREDDDDRLRLLACAVLLERAQDCAQPPLSRADGALELQQLELVALDRHLDETRADAWI